MFLFPVFFAGGLVIRWLGSVLASSVSGGGRIRIGYRFLFIRRIVFFARVGARRMRFSGRMCLWYTLALYVFVIEIELN